MVLRRALIPISMALILLVQFLPGTPVGPQPVAASLCDAAQFIADVTIPDGTTVSPGASFVKTWRLQNAGTCPWTTSYAVVFTGGTQMGSPSSIAMPSNVSPGGTVDITVTLTAPTTPGHYRGNYELKNASGVLFGVGANAAFLFWVDINVGTTFSVAYDFIANAGSATWSSGAGTLPFPGTDGDVKGFVLPVATPQLENGTTDPNPGLVVNPQQVTGGYIQGVYPAFTVQAGDRFQSIVNCTFTAANCYVNFRLMYRIGAGPVTTFWTFNERHEGLFFRANVDLTPLAGQSVNFILYVADVPGHGVPSGDRAEWVETKIARGGGGTVIPPPTVCDRGAFVGDVTIPDGTVVAPGQAFTKTWRVRNVGSCPWTTSYALVFVFGNTFGAAPVTAFSPSTVSVLPVNPGQTADFSLNMVAPTVPGHYRSYWRFRNDDGVQFGVGSGMVTFFADINVSGTLPTSTPGGGTTPTPTSTAIIPGPNTDLSVTVTDGVTTYTPGGTVTYTIVVTNNGPTAVTHATLINHKPSPHVTSWIWSCVADPLASCTAGPITSSADVSDDVSLPVGKKVTYTVVATINPASVGNLVETVTINNPASVPDPNLANNSATDTDAPPGTDLTVSMTQNTNTGTNMYILGGTIVYTIQMVNVGPLAVTGATFTDPIPMQFSTWTWACTATGGAVWAGPGTTTGNVSTTVNMPAPSSITCTVTATVKTSVTGDITNTATLLPPASIPDSVPSNNMASVTAIGPNANLSVVKTDGVSYYTPGGTLTYTITVTNNGILTIIGATFTDAKPAQISSWTWTCVADTGNFCTAAPTPAGDGSVTDTITLSAHSKVVYTAVATVDPAALGVLVNTATIQSIPSIPDLNSADNSSTDSDQPPSADLQIKSKNDGVVVYIPGQTVTYIIDVYNGGPQDVVGATFTDVKPAQVLSWTWSCAALSGATVTCDTGPHTTNADFGDLISLPALKTLRYTVVATIDPNASGDMVNTATVSLIGAIPPTDPNPGNNSATDTDRHPTADLAVSIVDNVSTYTPGGASDYTVTITNLGPDDVHQALVTAAWPLGTITNVAMLSSWTWTCVAGLGSSCTALVTNSGAFADTVDIAKGSQITYTVVANVLAGAVEPLPFNVTIASGVAPNDIVDPNLSNNSPTDINVKAP